MDKVIGQMNWFFTYCPGDWGSIPGQIIPNTQKSYLMPPCIQQYKVCIKGKVEQLRVVAFGSPSTLVVIFTNFTMEYMI